MRFDEGVSEPCVEFEFQVHGEKINFQVAIEATGSREACAILASACYSKFEQGWTTAEVTAFRDECSSRMRKGRRRLTRKIWAPQYMLTKPLLSPAQLCAPPSPASTTVPSPSSVPP